MKAESIALLEHSAILLTYIKQQSVLKPIDGLLFEKPLKTDFTAALFSNHKFRWALVD